MDKVCIEGRFSEGEAARTVSETAKIAALINQMPERQQEEIRNYARFLYQKA